MADDDRLRCLALGIVLHEVADELLDAADAARGDRPKRMGVLLQSTGLQAQIDSANRERILVWARSFDGALTQSEACGIEKNGYLGGEFGRLEDWEAVGPERVEDLARMAQRVAEAVHESAVHELKDGD